jgi:hypothetical protein
MPDKIWKPTPRLRFMKRLEPETGRTLRILQQEWEACTDALLRHYDYEWRDVEEVG